MLIELLKLNNFVHISNYDLYIENEFNPGAVKSIT